MTAPELDLDALLALAEAATPGLWEVVATRYATEKFDVCGPAGTLGIVSAEADARFIASARTAVPALVARCKAAEAERDEVQVRESDARRDHVSAMKRADAAEARVRDLEALLVAVIEEGEAIHTGKKRGLGEYARRESAVWDEARRLFALRAAMKGGTDG